MKPELPKFPAMLRKMWNGTEVQQWIDENVAPLFEQAAEPKMEIPSDADINAAWHELTGRACLPGSIAHASAHALLAKYSEQAGKCSEVADIDYKAMYEQMCERCDALDKALADERNAALDDAIAQCNTLDNDENSEHYRAGALWCAERIKALKAKP